MDYITLIFFPGEFETIMILYIKHMRYGNEADDFLFFVANK